MGIELAIVGQGDLGVPLELNVVGSRFKVSGI
jgi:hypothetical protein